MAVIDFSQTSGFLQLFGLECLRSAYAKNECTLCVDICYVQAFELQRGKLTLNAKSCTSCGACIGVCPTKALSLDFFETNTFVQSFQSEEQNLISCKIQSPCLLAFETYDLITLILSHQMDIGLDLSSCQTCPLDTNHTIKSAITNNIDQANHFLQTIGYKYQLHTVTSYKPSKLMTFRKAIHNLKQSTERTKREKVPYALFKKTLKNRLESLNVDIQIETSYPFANDKVILPACTNCGECIEFCPTDALFYSYDKKSIFFQSGKCIACSICNDICKVDAIEDGQEFDLVSFAYDRAKKLIHFEMEICSVCKCAFVYRGGDAICERCGKFENEFGDMFKLASEY